MTTLPKTLTSSSLAVLLIAAGIAVAAPPVAPFVGDNINISRDAGVAQEDDANPAIAYNPDNNQYLVVWFGDRAPETEGNAFEVFGRVFDAAGDPVSAVEQISETGTDTTDSFQAALPDVTYNPDTGEYLVVWFADDATNGDVEIHGQRVSGLGTLAGANFQISDTNATNPAGNAVNPAVAPAGAGGFLVVWEADGTAVDDEMEVFGRLVGADGSTPNSEFKISTQGTDGVVAVEAAQPDVAYSAGSDRFLIVWKGDASADGALDDFEVFGQLVNSSGVLVETNFPVSFADAALVAEHPAVAHNESSDEFMVSWRESVKSQILGRIVAAGGLNPEGANLDISAAGEAPVSGSADPADNGPALAFNALNGEYLVNWPGSVKGNVVLADGSVPTPTPEDFSQQIREASADVVYNPNAHEYFTVFDADGIPATTTNDKIVFGQRRAGPLTVKFDATDLTVEEGQPAQLTVTRVGDLTGQLDVVINTVDESAKSPVDYTALSDTVTILDGEASASVAAIQTVDNDVVDVPRAFSVELGIPPAPAVLAANAGTATVNITDNDTPPTDPAPTDPTPTDPTPTDPTPTDPTPTDPTPTDPTPTDPTPTDPTPPVSGDSGGGGSINPLMLGLLILPRLFGSYRKRQG